ncbi:MULTISPECIES: MFS transporter [Arthrobacter]|uniref:MFS transporter n=1 Tax=Arthrobacter terricola TaxID=2547396 RepID=A0A4R5KVW0_9MICC|nr:MULTISPECIES: MFS transporter [Arthrobacter]MBT8160406.1 MFS transporter [Arthrobacter sp. GN70]TDF99906.1 MFS transporter [Arthrobacter terricola]
MALTSPAAVDSAAVQRRTVQFLAAAQLLSGVGNGAALSIGSLLAVQLSGSSAWAGSVTTILTLAGAVSALPLAGLAERRGRRVGLVTGLVSAMVGAILVIVSAATGVFAVLLLGGALLGLGTAANLQARFAAVDLAAPESRGRSLATVVWAITVGAVAGPNLIQPGAVVGSALGLPAIVGPFVFSVAGLLLAAALLMIGLRPDPLLLARRLAEADDDAGILAGKAAPGRARRSLREGLRAVRSSPHAMLALASVIAAHGIMVAVMSMTPLHLQELVSNGAAGAHMGHGDSHDMGTDALVIIGFTISLHIAGMFALSPVMGWLTDRAGRIPTIVLGFFLLAVAVAVAVAGFGQQDPALVTTGLVVLGLGWSAATISGSTLLAESVEQRQRVLVQGVSDTLMGAAGALGGGLSGVVLSWVGYQGLNMASGAFAFVILAVAASAWLSSARGPSPVSG